MSDLSPLQNVISKIREEERLPIIVFDLDDTLFSTANRNLTIIRNFIADFGDSYPDFVKIASPLELKDMLWSVTAALENKGLDPKSPSIPAFTNYWGSLFFTDAYAAIDLPNPGAVDFANACYDAGALIFYLTGRHVGDRVLNNGMGQGTALSLTDRGFPFWKGRCELSLKEHPHDADATYKAHVLDKIKSLRGNVIATFDNEPANANMYGQHFPDGMNFWVKTTWDPKDKASTEGLYVIPDFSDSAK